MVSGRDDSLARVDRAAGHVPRDRRSPARGKRSSAGLTALQFTLRNSHVSGRRPEERMSDPRDSDHPSASATRRLPAVALGVLVTLCVLIGVVLFAVGMAQMR